MTPTETLSNFVTKSRFEDFPEELVHISKKCFLDWIGVTIGGTGDPSVKILVDVMNEMGGRKQASVIGYGMKTSMPNAALVNGTMSHCLDYDDAHMHTRNHPGAPLIAALLSVAEWEKVSGSALITAFIIGFEVSARVGLAMGKDYYDRGWHATAVLGRFGAAAGAGKLFQLNGKRLEHAFGLAATQAGGLRDAFGTMGKPFHAGKAAMDGIMSAMLSRRGFTSPGNVLGEHSGFFKVFSSRSVPDSITGGLGQKYHLPDVSLKPYAACLAVHPAIDGLISIRNQHGIDPNAVERIELEVAPICLVLGDNRHLKNGLEGKFSVYFCAALALAQGHARTSGFSDEMIGDALIRRLMERTAASKNQGLEESEANVRVRMGDGRSLERHVTAPKGDPRNPLVFDDVVEKFVDLSKSALPGKDMEQIISLVRDLEKQDTILPLVKILSSFRC